jgi:hypothetical protein
MTMAAHRRTRHDTRKEPVRYECRITRSAQPDQPELAEPLRLLEANTNNYIQYRGIGKIGVTIMMIEPVLRKILISDRRGIIPKQDLQDFEAELQDNLRHAQYADYDVPVDPAQPLALFGRNKDRLALQLHPRDYRLVGDRAVVESYIQDNYEQNDGRPVSRRFLDRNSARFRPHITIGDVRYENMDARQVETFQADPSVFLIRESYRQMASDREDYGESYAVQDIILPEHVALNGLKVFCQQKL